MKQLIGIDVATNYKVNGPSMCPPKFAQGVIANYFVSIMKEIGKASIKGAVMTLKRPFKDAAIAIHPSIDISFARVSILGEHPPLGAM
jgi:hypothetical protein